MCEELEETVKDEAILTGKSYDNPNDPAHTRSYFIVQEKRECSKNIGPELAKRKNTCKDLSMKCGKNKHQIITDSIKVNSYKALCAKDTHNDWKFDNLRKGFLFQQLEKPKGGSLLWIDMDGLEYKVEVPVGAKLLMFDISGCCKHKCKRGRYTICTDFLVKDYQSLLDYNEDEFIGSLQEMLKDYMRRNVLVKSKYNRWTNKYYGCAMSYFICCYQEIFSSICI